MEEDKLKKLIHIQCPNCGSSEIGYSAEIKMLQCTHCRHTWDLPKGRDKIIERKLGEGFNLESYPKGLGETETKTYHCKGCGSQTAFPKTKVNITCPFCGSTAVNEEASAANVIEPAGVLPFTFPQKQALAAFTSWIGDGWFHPNDLAKQAALDKIQGVYLPFWTFDAYTESTWTAESGYYYYTTETYTDSEGRQQTRQVQHVRWVPASGYYEQFFDDVLVVASHGIKQADIEKVYPFNLDEVVNYDSQYILGWECEIYQKDIKQGFTIADDLMNKYLYEACGRKVPGDTYRGLSVSTRKSDLTFKHILLPVWIAAYTYNNKIYQFIVNGQNGKIHGEKPYSPWKIALAIIAAIIVIGILVLVFGKNQ